LERTQRTVTQGLLADERRKTLIVKLHRQGMSQVEIAARLDRASRAVGGEGVGEDAVNKLVARARRKGVRA
jgi:transposase